MTVETQSPGPVREDAHPVVYFVSDIHLGGSSPSGEATKRERFGALLDRVAAENGALYILGDLFDEIPAFESDILAQLQEIGTLPIDLIAYEGGQGLRGTDGAENNDQLTDKLIAVNRDPGMGSFYDFYFAMWRRAGGKLFVPFNSTFKPNSSGSWGALEHYDSDELVMGKYSSMVQFIDSNPVWW